MPVSIMYEGTSWNCDYAGKLSEKEFIRRGMEEKQYSEYKEADRIWLIKEAYRLIQAKLNSYLDFEQ